jgi:hypothetical protein
LSYPFSHPMHVGRAILPAAAYRGGSSLSAEAKSLKRIIRIPARLLCGKEV